MNATPHIGRTRALIIDPVVEKSLLRLHAAVEIDSFWKAAQRIVSAVVPHCFMGMTLQYSPVIPAVVKWDAQRPEARFASEPLRAFLNASSHRRVVRASDVFPTRESLVESPFYLECLEPQNCLHAVGLPFRKGPRLICGIAILRGTEREDFSASEMGLLHQLYPHLQTALVRLRTFERERSILGSLEEFLNRLPLPTIVLRWNLQLVYWNSAAREFCAKWENGPGQARLIKTEASLPAAILDRCSALRAQWEQSHGTEAVQKHVHEEHVYHPQWPFLRATIILKPISSAGVTRPHFLIECEELRGTETHSLRVGENDLPHLMRLTRREQQLARLVCEGRSNQEIADEIGMSLQTVKNHLYAIFHKLEVTSRSRLIALMR